MRVVFALLGFKGEAASSMNMEQNGLRMFNGRRLAAAKCEPSSPAKAG